MSDVLAAEADRVDKEFGRSGENLLAGRPKVTCIGGPDKGKTIPLRNKPLSIGTHASSDFLIQAPGPGRFYAKILSVVGNRLLLTDLDSPLGVTVGGKRVRFGRERTVTLTPGDVFEMGEAKFLFHL